MEQHVDKRIEAGRPFHTDEAANAQERGARKRDLQEMVIRGMHCVRPAGNIINKVNVSYLKWNFLNVTLPGEALVAYSIILRHSNVLLGGIEVMPRSVVAHNNLIELMVLLPSLL